MLGKRSRAPHDEPPQKKRKPDNDSILSGLFRGAVQLLNLIRRSLFAKTRNPNEIQMPLEMCFKIAELSKSNFDKASIYDTASIYLATNELSNLWFMEPVETIKHTELSKMDELDLRGLRDRIRLMLDSKTNDGTTALEAYLNAQQAEIQEISAANWNIPEIKTLYNDLNNRLQRMSENEKTDKVILNEIFLNLANGIKINSHIRFIKSLNVPAAGLTRFPLRWLLNNTPQEFCWGNFTTVDLSRNSLRGLIPPEIASLTGLKSLHLSNNQLSGAIPPEIGSLPKLDSLFLGNNQLNGAIPTEIGNLSKLKLLMLCNNQLDGPIPPEIGKLLQLGVLHLSNNQLNGPIPPEIGKLLQLGVLSLNDNLLSGTIPAEIGNLTRLYKLCLWNNQLTGPIPQTLPPNFFREAIEWALQNQNPPQSEINNKQPSPFSQRFRS